MIRLCSLILALTFACSTTGLAAESDIAPSGKVRAVYIASNMAHAVQDRATGLVRGVAADLTHELGRRLSMPSEIKPVANPEAVIAAVNAGEAEIGFVAFANSRAGSTVFSQTYMLVQQTFIVLDSSSIRSVADADRAGLKVAGVVTNSTTAWIKRNFKQATVLAVENNHDNIKRMLFGKEIDAFAANRARNTTLASEWPGTRVLPDSLLRIPQSIIVPKGKPEVLAAVNRYIDEVRASGFLQAAIDRARIPGLEVMPPGSLQPVAP